MTNEEAFVKELITYIFYVQDEDDDNLSSEIICRKLHKYELIDKSENGWTPKDEELDCRMCKNWDFNSFGHWRCILAQDNPHWSCEFDMKPDLRKMPPDDGSNISADEFAEAIKKATKIATSPDTAWATYKDPRIGEGVCYTDRTDTLTTIDCGWK